MVKVAVTVATGVNTDRSREPLVRHAATTESGAVRLAFFCDLVARSLTRGGLRDRGGAYRARRPLPGCDRQAGPVVSGRRKRGRPVRGGSLAPSSQNRSPPSSSHVRMSSISRGTLHP